MGGGGGGVRYPRTWGVEIYIVTFTENYFCIKMGSGVSHCNPGSVLSILGVTVTTRQCP